MYLGEQYIGLYHVRNSTLFQTEIQYRLQRLADRAVIGLEWDYTHSQAPPGQTVATVSKEIWNLD